MADTMKQVRHWVNECTHEIEDIIRDGLIEKSISISGGLSRQDTFVNKHVWLKIATAIAQHAEQHEAKRLSYAEAQRDRAKAALREIIAMDVGEGCPDCGDLFAFQMKKVARDALKELEADDAS